MELEKRLVYYPGHLGEKTRVALRDPLRGLAFAAGQVRPVPRMDAQDLLRLSGFLEAMPLKGVAEGFHLEPAAVEEIKSRLTRIRRRELGELVLLDSPTRAALLEAAEAA